MPTFTCPNCEWRASPKRRIPIDARIRCSHCHTVFSVTPDLGLDRIPVTEQAKVIKPKPKERTPGDLPLHKDPLSANSDSQRFVIIALLIAVFVVIAGVSFVNIHFKKERIQAASSELSTKVEAARECLDEKKWDKAIQLLEEIKSSTDPDDLDNAGTEMLSGVGRLLSDAQKGRELRKAEINAAEAKARANDQLKAAETDLRLMNLAVAEKRLRQYLANPVATDRARAKSLLNALEIANSDGSAIEFLALLSEVEFSGYVATGELTSLELPGFDSLRLRCLSRLRQNFVEGQKKRAMLQEFRQRAERYADVKTEVRINFEVSVVRKKALIHGVTNLPAGTILMISVTDMRQTADMHTYQFFHAGDRQIVGSDGAFKSGAFGPESGLESGSYVATVLMPIASVQPPSTQAIIGSEGEELRGQLVTNGEFGVIVEVKRMFVVR